MYENQEVERDEARDFAKKINAIFKNTSCKESEGIEELFEEIGKHYLDPNLKITRNLTKEEILDEKKKIRIQELKDENQSGSKACC